MERERENPVGLRIRYLVLIDLISVLFAVVFSFVIRYEALINVGRRLRGNWALMITASLIRIVVHYALRLYHRAWRYASIQELKVIALDGVVGSVLIFATNVWLLPLLGIPYHRSYSILVLEGVLSTLLLGSTRFLLRLIEESLTPEMAFHRRIFVEMRRRVLVAGMGPSVATILREIQNNRHLGMKAIGLVDGNSAKRTLRIYGVPVLGTWQEIPTLAKRHRIDEVIIATPASSSQTIDGIYQVCRQAGVPVREIPGIDDLLAGTLTFRQLRQLRPLDRYCLPLMRNPGGPSVLHNILVTGGAGFIGSNFTRYMLDKYPNYRIVVYDKLTYAGNMDNLLDLQETHGERYVFVRGDICDYAQVADIVERFEIDTIVNFAAESHVDRSLMNPDTFLRTNVHGTHTLLKVARDLRLLRYHQVSTDEVYGQIMRGSFGEEDPLETRSPYSASKAGADLLAHAYYVSFGVPVTITRGSNNIGPYQYPEKAVPLFTINAMNDLPVPVYGDGLYVRDYQYVIDHCRGIDLVLHRGAPGEIYNLGSGTEVAALDLARMILDRLGKPQSLICLVADRPGQDRRYSVNCAKVKALGWEPKWTFDQALDDTIRWYLKNEKWWRKLRTAESEYCQYYDKQYRERIDKATRLSADR